MHIRIPPEDLSRALSQALEQGLAGSEDTSLIVYDLDRVRARLDEALAAFPESTLHAVAVKANPLARVLSLLAAHHPRVGAEAASLPELHSALAAGFAPSRILFDSPAKTMDELRFALDRGVGLNADNLEELERIAAIVEDRGAPTGSVGLRVNPQVGAGSIAATSVARRRSKFGEPLDVSYGAILEAFDRWPWLSALHAHIGSQGCSLEQLTAGARTLLDLAREVEARRPGQLQLLDVGGGLPATYRDDEPKPAIADYGRALAKACPELWSGPWRTATEFGRAVMANAGFAAARVEYVKDRGGPPVVVTHLGADMFLRKCYCPGDWHHDVLALSPEGALKAGASATHAVAGPLCFQGDFPAPEAELPPVEPGDWVVFRDAGAYTLSMWSRYNSRQMPLVLGLERAEGELEFSVLKARESLDQAVAYWE